MNQPSIQNFLTRNITKLDGVGNKTKKLLKKKNIEKISDLLCDFPHGYTDRSNLQDLDKLEIGKITTIKVKVIKYNFPRIRNLPNKVICEDENGKIDIIFGFFFFKSICYLEIIRKTILFFNSWPV